MNYEIDINSVDFSKPNVSPNRNFTVFTGIAFHFDNFLLEVTYELTRDAINSGPDVSTNYDGLNFMLGYRFLNK